MTPSNHIHVAPRWSADNTVSQSDGDTGYGGLNVTGLLGMGFPALAVGGDIKTYWVANAIGRFKKPMFSFYLQHTNALANGKIPHTTPGGVLTLGGVNKKFYKGEITYTDVQTPLKYWTIPLEEVKFNGQVASNGTADAIIDTGTSLIYGPIDVISPFIKSIPGARLHDSSYVVPCNTTATFSLKFSGREFTVPSKDFLYLATTADPTLCYTAIVGHSGYVESGAGEIRADWQRQLACRRQLPQECVQRVPVGARACRLRRAPRLGGAVPTLLPPEVSGSAINTCCVKEMKLKCYVGPGERAKSRRCYQRAVSSDELS